MTNIRHNSGHFAALYSRVRAFYMSMDSVTRNEQCAFHWWDHVVRVVNNAVLVAKSSRVLGDKESILAAALCHDLAYSKMPGHETEESSKMAKFLMESCGYSESAATYAANLVLSVDRNVKEATTVDAKILYIADKLDLFGVDGTVRLLCEHSMKGTTVRGDLEKVVRIRLEDWYKHIHSFRIASRLVEERYHASLRILDQLKEPKEPIESNTTKRRRPTQRTREERTWEHSPG